MHQASFHLITVYGNRELGLLGNTAAVVRAQSPQSEGVMQAVARDFNQPATAFIWPAFDEGHFHVRWFAPDGEIGLCGHGSLATIASIGEMEGPIALHYRDGVIHGKISGKENGWIDLEAIPTLESTEIPEIVEEAIGTRVLEYYPTSNKHILFVKNETVVKEMKPDFEKLRRHDNFGWIVTAPGNEVDFVSRTLVPHVNQLEDPATGSSHACLTPFWSERLNKTEMVAHQLSERGGRFKCHIDKESSRVQLHGEYSIWGQGELSIPD